MSFKYIISWKLTTDLLRSYKNYKTRWNEKYNKTLIKIKMNQI